MEMKHRQVSVTVKYFNLIRDLTGCSNETVTLHEGCTLGDLLLRLKETYGEQFTRYLYTDEGELQSYVRVVRSGRFGQEDADSVLSDDDEVYLFVATSGG